MRHRSDAYTLTVRQAPQRAKAFPGAPAKEKGTKSIGSQRELDIDSQSA